jgi:hypothetical protein
MKTTIALFVFTVCVVCLLSCSKQNEAVDFKQTIVGQWKGVSRISNYTFTVNGIKEYLKDTSICNDQDVYFRLYVKADSIITEASRLYPTWGWLSLKRSSYKVNNDTLSYMGNPFTTFEAMNVAELRSSEMLTLTKNRLVLHDIDTFSRSPIEVKEVWFDFVR